jgi:O-antigen/teichoic acid export membrane protein
VVSIIMVPIYIRYVGLESYGLIGFFAMIQAWFLLLDMGLSPTFSRQVARYRAGVTNIAHLRQLLHALEGLFLLIAIVACSVLYYFVDAMTTSWLKIEVLSRSDVKECIGYMIIIIALRWMSGLYTGAINGFEKQVWLSVQSLASTTLRFVMVLPIFEIWGPTINHFFAYQVIIASLELFILITKVYRLLPISEHPTRWSWVSLQDAMKFSSFIALNGFAWAFVTQLDKLILSKLLPLSDYAYFTMAVVVANGVSIVTAPIGSAILPRLSKLEAEGKFNELITLYRKSTRFATIMAAASSLTLAFFAEELLWAWTGDREIAARASRVLQFYALANGLLAIAVFPYYLQFAKGNLKLHLAGNIIFAAGLVPVILFLVERYGGVGAGYAWLLRNVLYFGLWIPCVHIKFAPKLNKYWFLYDIFPIYAAIVLSVSGSYYLLLFPNNRAIAAIMIMMVGALAVLTGAATTSSARNIIVNKLRAIYSKRGHLF